MKFTSVHLLVGLISATDEDKSLRLPTEMLESMKNIELEVSEDDNNQEFVGLGIKQLRPHIRDVHMFQNARNQLNIHEQNN